jgi:hypothetical protein
LIFFDDELNKPSTPADGGRKFTNMYTKKKPPS